MQIGLLVMASLLAMAGGFTKNEPPNRLLTPEQCKADIAFAFETLEDVHPNVYAYVPKEAMAIERRLVEKKLTEPMSRRAFWLRLAPLIARLRDGHTWLPLPTDIWAAYRDSGAALFPLDTRIEDGRMFVRSDYSASAKPPIGAEITSINGQLIPVLLGRLMPYANEERLPARWNQITGSLRASLWMNLEMTAPYAIEYRETGGKAGAVVLPGVVWPTIVQKREAAQKSPAQATYYRYRLLREDRIGLIEYEQCVDLPKFEAFLKATFTQIQEDKPRALIIDVRKNPGGIGGLNEALCEYITDKPYRLFGKGETKVSDRVKKLLGHDRYVQQFGERAWNAKDGTLLTAEVPLTTPAPNPLRYSGPIYCLIGPATFSNGMAFASAIQDCGLGVLVGEETGGLGSAYGDFVTFRLPNSGFDLNMSTKHIYRPSGVDNGHGLYPDFKVRQTREDTTAGRDTVLEFARKKALEAKP